MNKGKRIFAVLLALILVIGALPSVAFAAVTPIEGDDDALAYVTYKKVKYTPDKYGVIAIEVPNSQSEVDTSDIDYAAAKGYKIGSKDFADSKVKFPSKGGNISTELTINYTKDGDKTLYQRTYTVGFMNHTLSI